MDALDLREPAAPPPEGIEPNFDNPPNANAASVAFIILCLVIGSISMALRLWTRVLIARKLPVADALGFVSFGFFIGHIWSGFELWKTVGFFVQQYNVRLGSLLKALFPIWLSPLFYLFFMMSIKTAILLDWVHVFATGTRNKFFWTCWATIVINILFNAAVIVALHFYCTPVERSWNRSIPGTCRDRTYLDRTPALFNLCVDILILVLPQRVIWTLHMSKKRKIGISVIFSVGLMACACATARIVFAWNIDYRFNVTHDTGPLYLCVLGECTCAILVLTVPAVPRAMADLSSILQRWKKRLSSINLLAAGANQQKMMEHSPSGVVHEDGAGLKQQARDAYEATPAGQKRNNRIHNTFSKYLQPGLSDDEARLTFSGGSISDAEAADRFLPGPTLPNDDNESYRSRSPGHLTAHNG